MAFAQTSEPSFSDTVQLAWQARRWLLAGCLSGLAVAALFIILAVPHYRALIIVAPTTRSGVPDLPGPSNADASIATEYVLKSFNAGSMADFISFEAIVRETSVARVLMANPAIRSGIARDRMFKFMQSREPESAEELAQYLQRKMEIEPVGGTPLRRMTYDHPDPEFAKALLVAVYNAADGIIRTHMREKADHRIEWLRKTIAGTTNPDARRSLTALLVDQEQIRTVLNLNEPYAANVAEPAAVTPKPSWPSKALIVPVFMICGSILGAALFGVRRALMQP